MLADAIKATGIDASRAAALLGIDVRILNEWMAGQRAIPSSMKTLLSAVIGIDVAALDGRNTRPEGELVPAIWYRLRSDNVTDDDRSHIFLIRQLGYYIQQLEQVTETPLVGWSTVFSSVRDAVDMQAPPRAQGRQAARIFNERSGLSVGARGIGEVLRGNLRSLGIVVIETPITKSTLEGCCFLLGQKDSERPCIFANSHGSTWFRRNVVIAHELAHAIFDTETGGPMLDFSEAGTEDGALVEERADAFALELMAPARMLRKLAQEFGIDWSNLDAEGLARLVAATHVEKRALLNAARLSGFIDDERFQAYSKLHISVRLKEITPHALSAKEFIQRARGQKLDWINKSQTTIPSTRLKLPPLYINKVLEAFTQRQIARSKAAEMLMIDEDTFRRRFREAEEKTMQSEED